MSRKSADATRAVVNAFALGYFSAILRLRRDLPSAWRASALAVLSNSTLAADIPPDPRTAGVRAVPNVQGFKMIVMRCESTATMLSWRRTLTADQQEKLRQSLSRLVAAAAEVGVHLQPPYGPPIAPAATSPAQPC
jgi:hypothetical protein